MSGRKKGKAKAKDGAAGDPALGVLFGGVDEVGRRRRQLPGLLGCCTHMPSTLARTRLHSALDALGALASNLLAAMHVDPDVMRAACAGSQDAMGALQGAGVDLGLGFDLQVMMVGVAVGDGRCIR